MWISLNVKYDIYQNNQIYILFYILFYIYIYIFKVMEISYFSGFHLHRLTGGEGGRKDIACNMRRII